jgi:hypothetical protein
MAAFTSGNSVLEVAAVAPLLTGGLWRAPLGTALPTDTVATLNAAFVPMGFLDDSGVTRAENRPNNKAYAWGGSLVASLQQSYSVTYTFKFYEIMDPDVLKAVHSDGNVTVTAATSTVGTLTTTVLNPTLNTNASWVIAGQYQSATLRIALPIARVTQVGSFSMTHKNLATYDVTLESFPDTSGNFGYQYWNDGQHT